MNRRRLRHVWLIALALLALASSALAQTDADNELLNKVYDIARTLYCPVCPNETLDACRTDACAEWREEIRQQLMNGQTEEQIIASFVARYGERVVGSPQDPALRALSVFTPIVVALIALIAGGYTLWRWRSARSAVTAASPAVAPAASDDDYRARLERDLRE